MATTRVSRTTTGTKPTTAPTVAINSTTRTRSTRATAKDAEALSREMDRVLKVSEPEPQAAPTRKTPAKTTRTKADPSVTKTVSTSAAVGKNTAVASSSKPATSRSAVASSSKQPGPTTTATNTTQTKVTATASRAGPSKSTLASSSHRPTAEAPAAASSSRVGPSKSPRTELSAQPTKARTAASSSKGEAIKRPAVSSSKASTAPTTRTNVKTQPTSSSAQTSSSRPVASSSASQVPKARTRPPRPPVEPSLPWAQPDMQIRVRAKEAMSAINRTMKYLSVAANAGYKHGSVFTVKAPEGVLDIGGQELDEDKVEEWIDICEIAVRTLREADAQGILGNSSPQVDKAAVGFAGRVCQLGYYQRGLECLVKSRESILRRYTPIPTSSSAQTAGTDFEGKVQISSSSKIGPSGTIPQEWLDMATFPAAVEGSEIAEDIRQILFHAMIYAWQCLAALEAGAADPTTLYVLPAPTSNGTSSTHYLELARQLPVAIVSSALNILYRLLTGIPTERHTHWFYLRTIALRGIVPTITTDPPTRTTPQTFWGMVQKSCTSYIDGYKKSKSDRTKELKAMDMVSKDIRAIVQWVERCIESKEETKERWFSGKEWTDLMYFWIALARKIGDVEALNTAIACMAGSSVAATSSTTTCSSPSASARRLAKGKGKATRNEEAVSDVYRLCGDLARTTLLMEKYQSNGDDLSTAAVESGLKSVSLGELSDTLTSLNGSEESVEALGKASRAIERVRRGCLKITESSGRKCESKTLLAAAYKWMGSAIDLVEDLFQSPVDLTDVALDYAIGAIDTIIAIARAPTATAQSSISHLDRGRRLTILAGPVIASHDRADLLRCLSACSYNVAAKLWKAGAFGSVTKLAKLSCEAGAEALKLGLTQESMQPAKKVLEDAMSRRFELLASACYKETDRKRSVEAFFSALAFTSPSILEQVERAAGSSSNSTIFAPYIEFNSQTTRLAQTVFFDPTSMAGNIAQCIENCSRLGLAIRGAILERILEVLSAGAYKLEVAEICMTMGDALLGVYKVDSMPIRRLRTLVRMMQIIVQSGIAKDRFQVLATQASALSDDLALAEDLKSLDAGLMRFRNEMTASALLQQALYAYHDPITSVRILELARKAMQELRQCLIPPTSNEPVEEREAARTKSTGRASARAPRTPAKAASRSVSDSRARAMMKTPSKEDQKTLAPRASENASIFEDVGKLSRLLSSLASLLGMLGYVLAKVEALKLLRAVLRNEPDHAEEYIIKSAQLATEYVKLGKQSRARTVFHQAFKVLADPRQPLSIHTRVELYLRRSAFLASTGDIEGAGRDYREAERVSAESTPTTSAAQLAKIVDRVELLTRAALANVALASIYSAQGAAAPAVACLGSVFRLYSRVADVSCRIAPGQPQSEDTQTLKPENDDPFKPSGQGADEPSKDVAQPPPLQSVYFASKHLDGLQWFAAENLLDATLAYTSLLANRGSVKEVDYYLRVSTEVASIVRSPIMLSRVGAQSAELQARLNQFEASLTKLSAAEAEAGTADMSGPDGVEINRIKGDLYARQEMIEEAGEMFDNATRAVQGLDAIFNASEALVPSPRKLRASLSALTAANGNAGKGKGKEVEPGGEMVLPLSLARVLRQQAWLMREAGFEEDSEQILEQIKALPAGGSDAEDLFLDGKIGLHEAFDHFKTDLWMSSLTESTLAMPMGDPQQRTKDRLSTRKSIQHILQRSESSFIEALNLASSSGKVEDVRQSCLSLALLKTFQTSLGEGSSEVTVSAADILASAPAITLQRELLEAIATKYQSSDYDDLNWPTLPGSLESNSAPNLSSSRPKRVAQESPTRQAFSAYPLIDNGAPETEGLRAYWQSLEKKYSQNVLLSPQDISSLPANWVVISINVTTDKTTMFVSRHQADHEPIVFCLPLDRQGKREGEAEDELFTFDAAVKQLQGIIDESNDGARNAKNVDTREKREQWWAKRYELDKRMQELVGTMEFCWLGAFKTILSPQNVLPNRALEVFRARLERIFTSAISGADLKKSPKVHLDDTLLRTFAALSSKCKDEEVEDLVYFILDIYQFHGVQVALAELDIDLIGVDVKSALAELETLRPLTQPSTDEHIFLALDKNVSSFPWESIPILRGRAVSRIPSLPFLLDQVELLRHLPSPGHGVTTNGKNGAVSARPRMLFDGKRNINTRKVFYILNSSGDLTRTQAYFEPWLNTLQDKGWKGIIGRAPTELEMVDALTNYDLVLYFGHGGAEQYIRSHKVRHLPHCATVMLWGCSSGALKDQGDLDRTGTAYNYIMGGCPSLVANLWDVTDRDIDRLSEDVLKRLNLDAAHIPSVSTPNSASASSAVNGQSTSGWPTAEGLNGLTTAMGGISLTEGLSSVQAVALSREECKLKYLTGAAPVVYGLPMYFH